MIRPLPAIGGGGLLGAVVVETAHRWLTEPRAPVFPHAAEAVSSFCGSLAEESAAALLSEVFGRVPPAAAVLLAVVGLFWLLTALSALAGGLVGYWLRSVPAPLVRLPHAPRYRPLYGR